MINEAILVGRLVADPELKSTQSGIAVVSFTVAVNRSYKNASGGYDADFINCVAWRNQAEVLSKYFSKGDKVGVIGSIQTRSYEDRAGTKRYTTEVVADKIRFIDSKSERQESVQEDWDTDTTQDDTSLPFDM
jgi:single-strand DNA-binding protein